MAKPGKLCHGDNLSGSCWPDIICSVLQRKKSPIDWNWRSSRETCASTGCLGAQNENRLGVAPASLMLVPPYPCSSVPRRKTPCLLKQLSCSRQSYLTPLLNVLCKAVFFVFLS